MQKIFLLFLVANVMLTSCGSNLSVPTSATTITETNASPVTSTATFTSISVPSPTPVWSWIDYAAQFNDIVVMPNNEVWIAGYTGLVVHKCGGADCTSPNATYAVDCARAIAFTSYGDGWLLACSKIYHWDGDWRSLEWKLQRDKDEEGVLLEDIGFADSNNGWVVGYKSSVVASNFHSEAIVLHWNGVEWQKISLLEQIGRNDFALNAVEVVSDNDVWAVGDVVLHWNGVNWQEILLPKNINGLESVSVINETDVWSAGKGFVTHWDGNI